MANVLESASEITELLRETKRIAVLGIKTEAQRGEPAFDIPRTLVQLGYDVVPVPVYYPEVTEILGLPVVRDLKAITPNVDMVDVFRRSRDLAAHLDDLLALKPKSVWLQSGIRDDAFAAKLAEAGIKVVQNRCLAVELRRRS